MALKTGVVKFKDIELTSTYGYSNEWEGAPGNSDDSEAAKIVKDRRKDIIRYGTIDDDDASYSFDDFSLIQIRGEGWFLLNANGCSCPSPEETWVVLLHNKTLAGLVKDFNAYVEKQSYGTEVQQVDQFQQLFEFAKE